MKHYKRILPSLLLILILVGGMGVSIHKCCACTSSTHESLEHKCCSDTTDYGYKHQCVDEHFELDIFVVESSRASQSTSSNHASCYLIAICDTNLLHLGIATQEYSRAEHNFITSLYDPSTGLLRAPPICC